MVQLKVTPIKFGSFDPPDATALEFGGRLAEATKTFGKQVEATGQLVSNVEKARARSAAAQFDAALGLKEEEIKADINDIANWEARLSTVSKELRATFRKGFFINQGVFDEQASLRVAQRQVGLTSHKNRLLVEMGTTALNENLNTFAEEFAGSEDEAGRAVALFKMEFEVDGAVLDNIIFADASPGVLRSAHARGVAILSAQLLNDDPLELLEVVDSFSPVIGGLAVEKTRRLAQAAYERRLRTDVSDEKAARLNRERVKKEVQLKNLQSLLAIARDPGGPGLTTQDIENVVRNNPDALDVDRRAGLEQLVANGGRGVSPQTLNPDALREASKLASGRQVPPPDTTVEQAINNLAADQQIPVNIVSGLLKQSQAQKFGTALKILDRISRNLSFSDPAAMFKVAQAEVGMNKWILENPDKTEEDAVAQVKILLTENDPFELFAQRVADLPVDVVFLEDGVTVDVDASKEALKLRWTRSETGAIGPDEPAFITADKMRQEWEKIRNYIKDQELRALSGSN